MTRTSAIQTFFKKKFFRILQCRAIACRWPRRKPLAGLYTTRNASKTGKNLSLKTLNGLNLLRLCLSQMGATPVDASKITLPKEEDDEDPSSKYF
jgi:hypothetical protein